MVGADPSTTLINPSLGNIKVNYQLLKGFTGHMAETGVIVTAHLKFLKPPIVAFYELMLVDTTSQEAKVFCLGVAKTVKRMLTVLKRKWCKWELPHVPSRNVTTGFHFVSR